MYVSDNRDNIRTLQIEENHMVTQISEQGKPITFCAVTMKNNLFIFLLKCRGVRE